MYCKRCDENYFGGSLCPSCGGRFKKSRIKFSHLGEPVSRMLGMHAPSAPGVPEASEEVRGEGFLTRLCYKFFESVMACVLFSVVLRVVIFLVKVADSLMETGGSIRGGISFYSDIRQAIGWYEVCVWLIIFILIFRCRHNPE